MTKWMHKQNFMIFDTNNLQKAEIA